MCLYEYMSSHIIIQKPGRPGAFSRRGGTPRWVYMGKCRVYICPCEYIYMSARMRYKTQYEPEILGLSLSRRRHGSLSSEEGTA